MAPSCFILQVPDVRGLPYLASWERKGRNEPCVPPPPPPPPTPKLPITRNMKGYNQRFFIVTLHISRYRQLRSSNFLAMNGVNMCVDSTGMRLMYVLFRKILHS